MSIIDEYLRILKMETQEHRLARYERIRRLKKFLRPLPRRSNLHKYPVLRWFAKSARKRDYLWSIHPHGMVRAFYIGWIIALMPIYGGQMFISFLFCFALRANCLVAMALQWITNPLTIPFILTGQFFLGEYILKFFWSDVAIESQLMETYASGGGFEAIKSLVTPEKVCFILSSVLLGGLIIALIGAFISAQLYKYWIKKHSIIVK